MSSSIGDSMNIVYELLPLIITFMVLGMVFDIMGDMGKRMSK